MNAGVINDNINAGVINKADFVFVSNYLNHHQIPFCDAMYRIRKDSFVFIQTEPMEEERIRMGWDGGVKQPYLRLFYEQPDVCRAMISEAEVVLFGGCDDESYIEKRLAEKKPVLRYNERLYKTGQWKAVSPRGLLKKYRDHTRHRNSPVYLLCAGAYVPSDFSIVRAYSGKMYCWGYFPETKRYDVDRLLAGKGWQGMPYLLWAARMIDWKHPELPLETAGYLKKKGLPFHMDIIGGGAMEERIKAMRAEYGLEAEVSLPGFMPPEKVRTYMEKADIFLFTSDRQEGWGAVANEAMNSGCAVLADHMIGAVPWLIRDGENGLIYRDGRKEELFTLAEKLVTDRELCARLGRNAYRTITESWNAENAAESLMGLCEDLGLLQEEAVRGQRAAEAGRDSRGLDSRRIPREKILPEKNVLPGAVVPCAPAPMVSESRMYTLLKKKEIEL